MEAPITLPFSEFWSWLMSHPNCIIRGGTRDTVLYDDEDLHWHFAQEPDGTLLVQVLRGKRMVGELYVDPDRVAYAQAAPPEEPEEYTFELVSKQDNGQVVFFFVLAHAYDVEEEPSGRVH